jgi:hypothetical protein
MNFNLRRLENEKWLQTEPFDRSNKNSTSPKSRGVFSPFLSKEDFSNLNVELGAHNP